MGAGFGGLAAARRLAGQAVDVLVLDRNNYHTFLPLLYEVAAAGLQPADIAQPVRSILHSLPNVRCQLADVRGIELEEQRVLTDAGSVGYDYLVLAAGSTTNDFGLPGVHEHALGLKDLDGAVAVRNNVLRSLERAAVSSGADSRASLLTIVVVGGGPTGVELAGAMAELRSHVIARDYPEISPQDVRVILLEATDRLLSAFPGRLQRQALRQLRDLGVDVRLSTPVAEITSDGILLGDGTQLASTNVIWVAGVKAQSLDGAASFPGRPGGRVDVAPTLQLAGHPNVFVIGDMAHVETADGRGYPMLAPAAMQQGKLAAENILRLIAGRPSTRFRYRDRGIMATIGRQRAVAHVFGLQLTGFLAWSMWLFVHVLQIVGLRNKTLVLLNWFWNYVRYDRSHRLITDDPDQP